MFMSQLGPPGGRQICGMPARLFAIRLIAPLIGIGIAAAVIFTRKDGSSENYTSFGIICVVLIVALLVSQWQRARRLRALRSMNDAVTAANGHAYVVEGVGQGPADVPVAVPVGVITAPPPPPGSPPHGYPNLQYGYNTPVAAMPLPNNLGGYPQQGYPAGVPARIDPPTDEDPNPIRSTSIAATSPAPSQTTSLDVLCGRLNSASSPEMLIGAMRSYSGGPAPNSFSVISECAQNVRARHPDIWTHDVALTYGHLLQQVRSGAQISTL